MNTDRLVIGVGSPFGGDDAAGLAAADRLSGAALPGTRVTRSTGDPAELIDAMSQAGEVVIVDAVLSEDPPGTVRWFDAAAGPIEARSPRSSTHRMSLAETIELAKVLGRAPRRLAVIGITVDRTEPDQPLTPAVDRAVDEVVARLASTESGHA